jgi:hypothetical protein
LHQSDTLLVYEYIKNGSLDSILFGTFLPPHSTLHHLHITPRAVTSACQKSL